MEMKTCDAKKPYVFVSYARRNSEKVHPDVAELQSKGVNIWIDVKNMVGGKPVAQTDSVIRTRRCKAVLFYMCESSVFSEYCLRELLTAKKYNKVVIPVHCFSVSGLEKTILDLQQDEEDDEKIKVSDKLISEILKYPNGSEVISIPFDASGHIHSIIEALKSDHPASETINQALQELDVAPISSEKDVNETKDVAPIPKAPEIIKSDESNEDCMGKSEKRLKTPCVTATEAPIPSTTVKNKRRTFEYGGQAYKSSTLKMNLGRLATVLIKDYANETNVSADDLMELVNPKFYSGLLNKNVSRPSICRRNNPDFDIDEKLIESYINEPESIISIDGEELLVYRWWPYQNIEKLIGILGYENKVKRL